MGLAEAAKIVRNRIEVNHNRADVLTRRLRAGKGALRRARQYGRADIELAFLVILKLITMGANLETKMIEND